MEFKFLRDTVDISRGTVNETYFTQKDDGYAYTNFYQYKLAKAAKEFFAELVKSLDSRDPKTGKGKYTTSKEKEYIDEEATSKNKAPYAQKFLLLNEKWESYKREHPDEFDTIERIANTDSEELGLSEFRPDINCSLEEAIQAYWCAGELLKKYGKGEPAYDMLPKFEAQMSKDEFKDKHLNVRSKLRNDLGIPDEETLKEYVVETRPAIKGGRHPEPDDDSMFEEYSKEFTKFLLENS